MGKVKVGLFVFLSHCRYFDKSCCFYAAFDILDDDLWLTKSLNLLLYAIERLKLLHYALILANNDPGLTWTHFTRVIAVAHMPLVLFIKTSTDFFCCVTRL